MNDTSATLLDRAFSLVIAFLLPGLVVLFGVAAVNETVHAWLGAAQAAPSFAALVFVLLAALTINLVITAVRWWLFEKFSWKGSKRLRWLPACGPLVKDAPDFDQTKRKDYEVQYIDIRHQHYYHYLAYANAAVAVPIGTALWMFGSEWSQVAIGGALLGSVSIAVALSAAACDALNQYDRRMENLLGLKSQKTASSATSSEAAASAVASAAASAHPSDQSSVLRDDRHSP